MGNWGSWDNLGGAWGVSDPSQGGGGMSGGGSSSGNKILDIQLAQDAAAKRQAELVQRQRNASRGGNLGDISQLDATNMLGQAAAAAQPKDSGGGGIK